MPKSSVLCPDPVAATSQRLIAGEGGAAGVSVSAMSYYDIDSILTDAEVGMCRRSW